LLTAIEVIYEEKKTIIGTSPTILD